MTTCQPYLYSNLVCSCILSYFKMRAVVMLTCEYII